MPGAKRRHNQRQKKRAHTEPGNDGLFDLSVISTADIGSERGIGKFLNQVFSENQSNAHRMAAIEVMCEELEKIEVDVLYENTTNWIGHIMKMIEIVKENEGGRELALCCHTLCQLLILSNSSPELRRTISINVVPKLISLLLDVSQHAPDVGLIGSVNLIKVCMKYFGGACLSHKNKVEKYALNLMLKRTDIDSQLAKVCFSTLSYLPNCGGQGSTGSKHSEMWTNQMARLLTAISKLTTYLYTPCSFPDKSTTSEEPSGQPIPVISVDVTPDNLVQAAHYLTVYIRTIQCMLTTPFSWKVHIAVKQLLTVICNVTEITPDSVVFKRPGLEVLMVYNSLCGLHQNCMSLLTVLSERCGSGLYPYNTTISELLISQLTWTRVMLERTTQDEFLTCRMSAYRTMSDMSRQPGLHTMLSDIADRMVEHTLGDINRKHTKPVDVIQLSSSKKARRSHQQDISRLSNNRHSQPGVVERKMIGSGLHSLTLILTHSSIYLTTRVIKRVYESLIDLVLSVQSTVSTDCYSNDTDLRLSLYKCLMSSIHSYNKEVGPLTHIATQLLSRGLQDKCVQVSSLCHENLMICQLAIQSRSPALDEHNRAFLPPTSQESNIEAEQAAELNPATNTRLNSDGLGSKEGISEVSSGLINRNVTKIAELEAQDNWSTASVQGSTNSSRLLSVDTPAKLANGDTSLDTISSPADSGADGAADGDAADESMDQSVEEAAVSDGHIEEHQDDDGSDIVELVTLEEDQSPVGSESGRVQNENSPPQEQLEAKSQSKLPADVNVKLSTPGEHGTVDETGAETVEETGAETGEEMMDMMNSFIPVDGPDDD